MVRQNEERGLFPDGANGMAAASCNGLNWRLEAGTYPAVYFRFHVYDQQRRSYVYTSSWQVVNGIITGGAGLTGSTRLRR